MRYNISGPGMHINIQPNSRQKKKSICNVQCTEFMCIHVDLHQSVGASNTVTFYSYVVFPRFAHSRLARGNNNKKNKKQKTTNENCKI